MRSGGGTASWSYLGRFRTNELAGLGRFRANSSSSSSSWISLPCTSSFCIFLIFFCFFAKLHVCKKQTIVDACAENHAFSNAFLTILLICLQHGHRQHPQHQEKEHHHIHYPRHVHDHDVLDKHHHHLSRLYKSMICSFLRSEMAFAPIYTYIYTHIYI